jgi:RimJ/RimL family protein N-acetyltransferase
MHVASGIAASETLHTERLELRRITLDDAAFMLQIWNDPAFLRYVGDRGIRTEKGARDALEKGVMKLYREHGIGPYHLSLKETGVAIGICGLFQRDHLDAPDIGFSLLEPYRGQGYAYEAAAAVVADARNRQRLTRITAIVSPANAASIALIEKLGLQYEKILHMPGDAGDTSLYGVNWH